MNALLSRTGALLLTALLWLALSACERQAERPHASGTFEADEVDVGNLLPGRLVMLDKQEGDTVTVAELLATIDSEKLELERELLGVQLQQVDLELALLRERVEAQRISLQNERRNLERIRNLHEQQSATGQRLDDLQTAVRLRENQLQSARKELEGPAIKRRELQTRLSLVERQIEDSRVYAPISGQVLARFAEPGEVLVTAAPLLRLADLSRMKLRVYLPAALLGGLKLGQTVEVRADGAPERALEGTLAWISSEAEFTPKNVQTPEARAELVYAVEVRVPNPDGMLKIGMPGDVYFE